MRTKRRAASSATGAVGSRWLRPWRLFRYEIRCWRGGVIPDLAFARGGRRRLSDDPIVAQRVLDAVAAAPTPVWGRDELGTGEMWNSNSLISWSLEAAGLATGAIRAPAGGRAPGWDAGLVVARRPAAAFAAPRAGGWLHRGAARARGRG